MDDRNTPTTALDGDASIHLEELLAGEPAPLSRSASHPSTATPIELVGPHLRLSGTLPIGYHRRLSDFLNHHAGLLRITDVTVLRRNGEPTRVTADSMWTNPTEVSLVAATNDAPGAATSSPDLYVPKVAHTIVVVTSGHTMTGDAYIPPAAELGAFIESTDPPFIPLLDVRARSLADRRIIVRYGFALLNRRHIVAATALQAGMIPGRTVL